MRFIVTSTALLKNLQQISGVISANTVLSVLEDFLFELKGNTLTLTATDLETMMHKARAGYVFLQKYLPST
jgi:DNA polymerase-3 subunit beta